MKTVLLLMLVLLLSRMGLSAQETIATNEPPRQHSPHRATLYSLALPGLGQAYNRKYWKIPIVYAGIGTIGYFALNNRENYLKAKEAYIYTFNNEDYPIDNDLIGKYNANDLREIRDYYRRNMELSWIIMALWYALNAVDAAVDAHLFDYDVGENLSVQLSPQFTIPMPQQNPVFQPPATGLKISVRF
jgi:hypothetical protein